MNTASSTAVAQATGTNVAAVDDMVNAFTNAGRSLSSGGVQFLKFSKGEWNMGREGITFPNNQFYGMPNLGVAERGWQCWKDGGLVDEVWNPLSVPLVPQASLPDHAPYGKDDGWSECVRFQLLILPNYGDESLSISDRLSGSIKASYTANSQGGRTACGALFNSYGEALRSGQAIGKFPVVHFETSSYKHTKYGKVYVPVMNIVGYLDEGDAALAVADTGLSDAEVDDPQVSGEPEMHIQPPQQTANVVDDEIPF